MKFSHIYVERQALEYPLAEQVLSNHRDATVVMIDSYKRIFNRPKQDFRAQKKSVKLILAVKRPPFVYPVSENCQTFGIPRSYYTTPMLGCPFDCDYCYLHGVLNSANLVLFVNTADFFDAVTALQRRGDSAEPLQVSLTYDTDLLPLERDLGLCRKWIRFAEGLPDLIVEIRTKSVAYNALRDVTPAKNFKLAWSLSPDTIIRRYEHKTPSLKKRLEAIRDAARDGWAIRLCFDPIVPVDHWEEIYRDMFDRVFESMPSDRVEHVAVGSFRLGESHLKRMRAARPRCDLFYRSLQLPPDELESFVSSTLNRYVEKEKVDLWKPPS